ncbi:SGNH/GDSL hydrolase family protein (plasmid) [Skermanella mucosa]|uniref:SGNH/GDSL hydrolase family protein n=1 Tax=Skermanella mucosa TaxID=1789672 RepID=UPI00192C4E09|nr:SGNH/GDSL hydrolase family protein [Skermanella mucosa]UEM24746.1 SGNH/GDSL hydrolase family protein [Skermanella mucosa]
MLLGGSAAQAAEGATKRIMVYGDSNTWGYVPVESGPTTRYPEDVRWPGVLRAALGPGYEVIDEGLSARTTDLPDPTLPQISGAGLDGSAYLPAAIASHLPLDLVVIMLGTNDLKKMFNRSPLRIALGVGKLADIVNQSKGGVGTSYPAPRVLILCPPPLGTVAPPERAERFAGGIEKSKALPAYYEAVAEAAGAGFLDVGTLTATDGVDGIHLTAAAHRAIGNGVADKVRTILK